MKEALKFMLRLHMGEHIPNSAAEAKAHLDALEAVSEAVVADVKAVEAVKEAEAPKEPEPEHAE